MENKAWVCIRCNAVKAPHVDECKCPAALAAIDDILKQYQTPHYPPGLRMPWAPQANPPVFGPVIGDSIPRTFTTCSSGPRNEDC